MKSSRRVAALATAVCLTVSGCASEGLASLPLPAPGAGSGGYTLTAVFSNALNLPANAKVKLAGADVGQLEDDGGPQLHRGDDVADHGRGTAPGGQHRRTAVCDSAG